MKVELKHFCSMVGADAVLWAWFDFAALEHIAIGTILTSCTPK